MTKCPVTISDVAEQSKARRWCCLLSTQVCRWPAPRLSNGEPDCNGPGWVNFWSVVMTTLPDKTPGSCSIMISGHLVWVWSINRLSVIELITWLGLSGLCGAPAVWPPVTALHGQGQQPAAGRGRALHAGILSATLQTEHRPSENARNARNRGTVDRKTRSLCF